MANTSNSNLTTDFNVVPYYDDFDENKNFYRILYKPGYAVQARELTQMQTILQKQIDRFGKHVFREGSIVLPGNFDLMTSESVSGAVDYVKVNDTNNSGGEVDLSVFEDVVVQGLTNGVQAQIRYVTEGSQSATDKKTIYVDYLSTSNSNTSVKTFVAGEVLSSSVGNLVVHSTAPTGKGSMFRISEGVVFAKGHFILFPTQTVIVDRYNANPTKKVGFTVNESIIQSGDDSSLLDPALESSNYSAPGADRFKLYPELTVVDYEDPIGAPDFVTLFTIKDGILQTTYERTQYNILQDEMAKRTADESGDYYVNGLNISIREHLDDGSNGGRYLSANGGNSTLLAVEVSPGLAYVQGYEVGLTDTKVLNVEKALTYKTVNSQVAAASMGTYVTTNEFVGTWNPDTGVLVNLYDTAQSRISQKKWSTGAQTGNIIGTARLKTLEYNSGTLGTANGRVDVYLSDVRMTGSNSFSNVRSVFASVASASDIGADVVLEGGNAVLQDTTLNPLLYFTGSNFVRSLKDATNTSDTTYVSKKSTAVSIATDGTFSLPLPAGADGFTYGTSTLSAANKREIILNVNQDISITQTGTVSGSGTSLTAAGGASFTRLNVGDKITITGVTGTYYIASITSASAMSLTEALASNPSGAAFQKVYKKGDIIDLTGVGSAAGTTRSVSATPTQLNFNLQETFPATVSAAITYRVFSQAAREIAKALRPSRYVKIGVSAYGTTTGPYTLGFSDIYRVSEIRKHSSAFTSNTQGTVVTSQFIIDNGQRDSFYDHGSIKPKSALGASDFLLVKLDYFEPDYSAGAGFFSVDSYPINDTTTSSTTIKTAQIPIYKSPVSGTEYDLRNYLDFRPVKAATATVHTDGSNLAAASTNPTSVAGFSAGTNGLRFPAAGSQITFDYTYYEARRDVVVLTKDKQFSVIKGVPGVLPITPSVPDNYMSVGALYIAPYPSISPYYGNLINRKDLSCSSRRTASIRHTMKDIGVLKDRIVNLEYYAALSLLEKSAVDMKITDANNLDRFKNGIFVDTFSGHDLGATYNPDYAIVVDPKEKSIRPMYSMESMGFEYVSGTNVVKTGDYLTLSYTQVPWLEYTAATTTRNTERTTYRFLGNLYLNPETDIWVDTSFAPDASLTFGPTDSDVAEIQAGLTTEWDAWRTYVAGYKVFRGNSTDDRYLVGTYATRREADLAAARWRFSSNVTIETMYKSERTGVDNFVSVDIDTQSLGDKVVDVSLQPYIRPQTIKIKGRGLKPFTKYYSYFDGVDLSKYVTPLTTAEFDLSPTGRTAATEGAELRADADGEIRLLLRLPAEKRFTTGTKKIIISDSPTNDQNDITSFAEGYFVSQGLVQQKQNTILTTRQVIPREQEVSEIRKDPSQLTRLPMIVRSHSCLAYAVMAKAPAGEEGMFLSSVKVYVADKHPTLGLWVEVRELDAGGSITRNQVPGSEIWYKSSDIPISTDGATNGFTITFPTPLFLMAEKQYAIVLHPEAVNPNYYFWVSRIGQTDVNTGLPVNSRVGSGTLFTTNNDYVWDIVPDVDLTCTFNRASFVTNTTGQVFLGNKPVDKLAITSVSAPLTRYGDIMRTGDKLTLSSITGGTIAVTDRLVGGTSNVNTSVLSIATKYYMANTGFVTGETVTVRTAAGALKGVTATVAAVANSSGTLSKYRATSNTISIVLNNSTGGFEANDRVLNFTTNDYATVNAVSRFRYSVLDVEPSYLKFSKNTLEFEIKGYSNTGSIVDFTRINPNENYYFADEMAVYSRTTELASYSGNRTSQLRVNMSTTSDYMSPVIDLGRSHGVFIDNIINNDVTGETNPTGGNLLNKYISKTITLAEGQDAEDLQVILTAYRPPNTDVRVWVKILHAEDSDSFNNVRGWIELDKTDSTIYSALANRNDFKEFTFGFPTSYMTGPLGQVQYTNSQNIKFTGYKYFAIKIGLTGTSSAVVPRVADLRAIALQI